MKTPNLTINAQNGTITCGETTIPTKIREINIHPEEWQAPLTAKGTLTITLEPETPIRTILKNGTEVHIGKPK